MRMDQNDIEFLCLRKYMITIERNMNWMGQVMPWMGVMPHLGPALGCNKVLG